jgi:hypothetical protein
MLDNVFTYCGELVSGLFEKLWVYNPLTVLEFSAVDNQLFYTTFLTSSSTVFYRVSGGDLRGNV